MVSSVTSSGSSFAMEPYQKKAHHPHSGNHAHGVYGPNQQFGAKGVQAAEKSDPSQFNPFAFEAQKNGATPPTQFSNNRVSAVPPGDPSQMFGMPPNFNQNQYQFASS